MGHAARQQRGAHAHPHVLRARGLDLPARIVETLSFPLIRALLLQRNIVAALPWQIVQADIEQGILAKLPVDIGYPALPVGIITHAHDSLSAAALRMVDNLKQAAGELYHRPRGLTPVSCPRRWRARPPDSIARAACARSSRS